MMKTASILLCSAIAIGCQTQLLMMTMQQETPAPKCPDNPPQGNYDKICKSRTVEGKKGFIVAIATRNQCLDGTTALAPAGAPTAEKEGGPKKEQYVPPVDLILKSGWIYITGDSPVVQVGNIVIAQAEGSRMVLRKLDDRVRVIILETGKGQTGKVWPAGVQRQAIAVPEGHRIDALIQNGNFDKFDGPFEVLAGDDDDLWLKTDVRDQRIALKVP